MGMSDKMPADHPFIIEIATEGISHPSMNPAEPHSGMHGVSQARAFLRGKFAAGPAGRNDIEGLEPVGIGKAVQSGDRLCFPSTIDQRGVKFMDDLFRLVTIPAALNKQELWRFHFLLKNL